MKLVAQEHYFTAGLNGALDIGDDLYGFGYGAELQFQKPLTEKLTLGTKFNFVNFIADERINDGQLYILAATSKYTFNSLVGFGVGLDVGVALSGDFPFYYMPKITYDTTKFTVSVGYQSVTPRGFSINSVNVGAVYKFRF
ncbi:MAG: hypothetical protein WBA16_04725 [Nonlabens sp.]